MSKFTYGFAVLVSLYEVSQEQAEEIQEDMEDVLNRLGGKWGPQVHLMKFDITRLTTQPEMVAMLGALGPAVQR